MGDLFDKIKIKSLKYKTSELPSEAKDNFTLPALTAGIQNQGLNNFVPKEKATILKNVISISANGANTGATFYQSKDFTILQDAYAINWIYSDRKLSHNQYRYLTTSVSKTIFQHYEWTNKAGWQKIKNDFISLPTKNNQPDFDFMENFISQIENERIQKLQNYLEVTGLQNYNLTEKEKEVLKTFENDEVEWGEFRIGELFEINSYKKRFDANKVVISEIGNPYVVRTALNNGVRGYIDEDVKYLNSENTISFGQDTATIFYQDKPYFTGDKIKILKSKDNKFNKKNALFYISTMSKSFSSFSWGGSSFNVKIIANQIISLPNKNNKPNFEMMETLISAIQKQIIQDVVLYVDDKLSDEVL